MRLPRRPLPRLVPRTAAACAAVALACLPALPAAASGPDVAFRISDPRITESSGLVASRLHPGVYWTHNDSGDGPYVYGIDAATGRTVATLTLRGVHPRDAEAISIGPDGDLYLGDIGDNLDGAWSEVWIYRFPEPRTLADQTVDATRYTVQYADGPRNAEALMVQPRTGRVYIASKKEDGGHLYEGPARLSASGVNVFHSIGDVPWVTDGAFSPDGSRLVLRGYFWATDYRWSGDRPHQAGQLDVPVQPQGESVAFTPDGRALMFGSEGKDSAVWRESLSGADLPDDAAASPSATPSTTTAPGTSSGTSSGASTGSGVTAPKASAGSKALGFLLLVVFGLGGFYVSKVLRRGRRNG
ncbi:hypothetical protein [Actinacidiphila yeochonensis]|uniref:hypothetical protein n=1 Tax=Actinacidiphila yeochonensis TaxID=89050 RepID=UPI0006912F65|nr:hypothetical protein [Actinacidiphila yeochonensis]